VNGLDSFLGNYSAHLSFSFFSVRHHFFTPFNNNKKTPDIYDVVVIGAGMAGVAAAAAVKHANMSVVILEARQYVGGRVHSVPFAGTTIELGANWIHGTRGAQLKNTKQPNPVADAAVKIGLNTIWVPGSCKFCMPLLYVDSKCYS